MSFGLTAEGLVIMRQADISAAIQASLQASFGENINLLPESVFGQIVGIVSEREALVWELLEAIYISQYPSGAQGTSVDNILALNNLKRLKATPSKTAPIENGVPGLVLYGTPGTVIPINSIISVFGSPSSQFTLDATVTIQSAVDCIQSFIFSNVPDSGSFQAQIADPDGNTLTTAAVPYTADGSTSLIKFSAPPGGGSYTIQLSRAGVISPAVIPGTSNAAAIQVIIRALGAAYNSVIVTGNTTAGFTITWNAATCQPVLALSANTTGVTVTPVDSFQASVNNLHDTTAGNYPYTDVSVSGTFTIGFTVTFGLNAVVGVNPSSGDQPQALFAAINDSLFNGATFTNINVILNQAGLKAQAIANATATVNGPTYAPAHSLIVIGTPVGGWTSVDNPLDVTLGTNIETDTQALTRRNQLLSAQANGPLQAIIEKVLKTDGVTSAIGFQNLTGAANQLVTFSAVPVAGNFQITIGAVTTANIPYTATASVVQAALNALSGFASVVVTGTFSSGFQINFNGASGGQAQPLGFVPVNTLGVTAYVNYARPPHSFEIVALGGTNSDIATAIYQSKPAGIQSFGQIIRTTGNTLNGDNHITSLASVVGLSIGQLVTGPNIPPSTFIIAITPSSVTISQNATGNNTGAIYAFQFNISITDNFGNPVSIGFSRPTLVPIYVKIALTTDQYNIPGVSGSGLNPNAKFNPGSIPTIQNDIITIGNAVPIGGRIIGFGSDGLIGAFNNVPGIISYTLYFDEVTNPVQNNFIQLFEEQLAQFETFNVVVSFV